MKRFTEQQIIELLKVAGAGTPEMTQTRRLFNLATLDFANQKLVALMGAGQASDL